MIKDTQLLSHRLLSSLSILDMYVGEIKDIDTLRSIKQKQMDKHIQSFAQYFPFKENDVLFKDRNSFLFIKLERIEFKSKDFYNDKNPEIYFSCVVKELHEGDYGGKWLKWSDRTNKRDISLKELSLYTVYRDSPISLPEMLINK